MHTDLKTALSTALDQWEKPAAHTVPKSSFPTSSNNVCRETFFAVKQNPGLTRPQLVKLLGEKGFRYSSTTSLLSRMRRQGLIYADADDRLYVTYPDYTPLKSDAALKKKKVKVKANDTPAAPTPQVGLTAESIIATISLSEAKRLFTALAEFFG
jgi:hypothetical protein